MIRRKDRGQILPIVMVSLLLLTMVTYGLVTWIMNDSRTSTKEQLSTSAVNLAEAAVDRGLWKLQSSTTTWAGAAASGGAGISGGGYNFDKTYTDIPGGTYRIKFTSGPAQYEVTVIGEGRDNSTKEVRAITGVYKNQAIYSALMSGGTVTWSKGLCVFWGPIMSQGDIILQDDNVALWYFPRKYAKGVVQGTAANPRDVNGLAPPNTDNTEWWSEYAGVPAVPVLDFVSLRSSAAATGTLNVYGCRSTQGGAGTNNSATRWDVRSSCGSNTTPHSEHFGNSWSHPKSPHNDGDPYVWYWDGNLTLSGDSSNNTGLYGTVIVRGNLTIDTPGEYNYTGHVPSTAWEEETRLLKTTDDTSATNQYPADTGYHSSASTHNFGTSTFNLPGVSGGPYHATVGIRGFTYVGGNLTILNYMDFNGAVWVNGTVTANNANSQTYCGIFYDDTLQVPALNVILLRMSWQESAPSSVAWP